MRVKLNKKKYKFKFEYYKQEGDLEIELPSYTIISVGELFYEKKWEECIFYIHDFPRVMKIFVSPRDSYKNGVSNIGKVDKQGFVDIFEIRYFKRLLIKMYQSIYILKLNCLGLIDRLSVTRKKLLIIGILILLTFIYPFINKLLDGQLEELIAENYYVQSIFLFFTLLGIVSIFFPMNLTKSLSIKDDRTF